MTQEFSLDSNLSTVTDSASDETSGHVRLVYIAWCDTLCEDKDGRSDVVRLERKGRQFQQDLSRRIADWEKRAADLRGRPVVVYHKQWEYLADWLGLQIIAEVEDKPGIPPSPRHIARLIEQMKAQHIRVLLSANFTR